MFNLRQVLSIANKEFNTIEAVKLEYHSFRYFKLAFSTNITVIHLDYCCQFNLIFKTKVDYFDMDQQIKAKQKFPSLVIK